MGKHNLFEVHWHFLSASDDTIHCNDKDYTQSELESYIINKKEIVSITEKYSIPWNIVTQLGEYMNVGW